MSKEKEPMMKAGVLVYVTPELLRDVALMEYISGKAAEEVNFLIDDTLVL